MSFGKDPLIERKADTKKNGKNLEECIAAHREREKSLYPLRINRTTVIYVTKDKCTPEYAEKYAGKMKLL